MSVMTPRRMRKIKYPMKSSPRRGIFGGLVGLALVALASGCTTVVTVNSLARPDADAISYELRKPASLTESDAARYKEGLHYIRAALYSKGMYEVPAGTKPDVMVNFDFGVTSHTSRETQAEPIIEAAGGTSAYAPAVIVNNATGSAIFTRYEPPRLVVTGYRDVVVTSTIYEKHLRLTALDASAPAPDQPQAEIWMVDVTSEGQSRDLRKALPILVAASIDYIGKDSHGQKTIRIKDNAPTVRQIEDSAQALAAATSAAK